nr:esterase [Neobacillus sp. Marseille-Q6967]
MFIIEKQQVNNIPLLHIVKKGILHEKLPFILFLHGFTSAKENNLHYAYFLAEKGFRVVLPESLYHGERNQGFSEKELYIHFWKIVLQTIQELPSIKDYYVGKGLADEDRIGLAGTSMGGIVTLGALTQYSWIRAAVSLMGMPAYEKFSRWQIEQFKKLGVQLPFTDAEINDQLSILSHFDLSQQPEKLKDRPLLFWHGKKDPVVPYDLTYQFYQSLEVQNRGTLDNIQFITDEHADHKVSREGLLATVDWFDKFLLH